ncbi:MAG: transcription-repair coupling factor, partial [bacterium]
MNPITTSLLEEAPFARLVQGLESGRSPAFLSGVGALARAHAAAALRVTLDAPLLCLCADEQECGRFAADLREFLGEEVETLFAREFVFRNAEGVSREGEHRRIATLERLRAGTLPALVTTPEALLQKTLPPETFSSLRLELRQGGSYDLAALTRTLTAAGYVHAVEVEGIGQFSLRGGILDFFSPGAENPVRCEFFGDEIDSMGYFNVATQRRVENVPAALLLPARETAITAAEGGPEGLLARMDAYGKKLLRRRTVHKELPRNVLADMERIREGRELIASDRYLDLLFPAASAADYLPPETLAVLCEPGRLADRAKNYLWQLSQDLTGLTERGILEGSAERFLLDWDSVITKLTDHPMVMMAAFTTSALPLPPRTLETLTAKQLPSYGGSFDTAAGDIAHYLRTGFGVGVFVKDKRRSELLSEALEKAGVKPYFDFAAARAPEKGRCMIALGNFSAGLEYPGLRLALLSEGLVAGQQFRRKARKSKLPANRQKLDSFSDLTPGDLVVHEMHGIGVFEGMVTRQVEKVMKDYIRIRYAGSDVLYVPATQLDLISKYIGAAEDSQVKLSGLGGTDWQKAKKKAKAAVKELAEGLLKLQAERQKAVGFPFSPDSAWQLEFEEDFDYQETDDQLRAIRDIKHDMESPVPMDRLLCGDVGYGKTEVALRAVMKCVLDGKQAAILVPTTVLALQHYQTCMRRFANFPVNIQLLSRLNTPAETKKAQQMMLSGEADIVIGTHKLLQKNTRFKQLGLLVVDEEQRFGVVHKERLKELTHGVDVLTLSATPIPRTLNMALSGVRDMSTIEEPPSDRQPVQTYVMEHDWGVLADAIRRELGRGGQVYYVHNRIESIERTALKIQELIEGVTVAVGHGQMDENELGRVMDAMVAGEVQVLVSTTIIETGIDIPNVNTLIIEDADRMGLSQLHQLRGRVGRSSRRAYAYFTFRPMKVLSETAEKRLSAIREFAEFNSGFK